MKFIRKHIYSHRYIRAVLKNIYREEKRTGIVLNNEQLKNKINEVLYNECS